VNILALSTAEAAVAITVLVLVGGVVLLIVWQLLAMGRDGARRDHDHAPIPPDRGDRR
jgi:hypothetical protein